MSHAITADSVMNYDSETPENYEGTNFVRSEPDCAPHPLDLLGRVDILIQWKYVKT